MSDVRIGNGAGSPAIPFKDATEYKQALYFMERGTRAEAVAIRERLRATPQATLDKFNEELLPGGGGQAEQRRGAVYE